MTEPEAVQHFRVDARPFDPEARLALVRNFVPEGFEVFDLPGGDPPTNGYVDIWIVEGLVAARNIGITGRMKRALDAPPDPRLRLRLIRSGEVDGVIGGQLVSLRAGDFMLHTNDVDSAVDMVLVDCDVFSFGPEIFAQDIAFASGVLIFPPDIGEAAVLGSIFGSFFDRIADATADEAQRMADIVVGALRPALTNLILETGAGHREDGDRVVQMRRFVEDNLSDPELGLDRLQDAHPASRAVIYRAFAELGGLRTFITCKRMERALKLLVTSPPSVKIGQIARRVGYPDQRVFARAFRRRYGVTPSEARSSFESDRKASPQSQGKPAALATRLRAMLDHAELGTR